MSANVSYQRAAEDIEYFTGAQVSKSVQQRLVHRQDFALPEAESTVEQLSVDGGNIRIRTPIGESSDWKGYKAVCLHEQGAIATTFGENAAMIDWVNTQPKAVVLTEEGVRGQRSGVRVIGKNSTPKRVQAPVFKHGLRKNI